MSANECDCGAITSPTLVAVELADRRRIPKDESANGYVEHFRARDYLNHKILPEKRRYCYKSAMGTATVMKVNDPQNIVPRNDIKELTLLYEISRLLEGTLDLRVVVNPVLEAHARHMGIRYGTLTLLNRRTNDILIEAAHLERSV